MTTQPPGPRIEAIVIGASAGGVEALLSIFSALRAGFRLPIIVVLHLPEQRNSQLADVMARRVPMPVIEAGDKMPIEAGTLYLATPGYHLSVELDRSLSLSLEERLHYSRPAIDYLFESAADAYGPALLAVLLTGANQEHGILARADGAIEADIAARFPLGTRLRILPNHACATGAQFPAYQALAVDGSVQTWERLHGW